METITAEINPITAHAINVSDLVKDVKRDFGIFFTPEWVVDFMAGMINEQIKEKHNALILEPACGVAQFLTGIKRNHPSFFGKSKKFGVEINEKIVSYLKQEGLAEGINLAHSDYLLWEPGFLFDLIIGNPPYGIPSLSEHYAIRVDDATKQRYKQMFSTWHGKYNVYGAFIEKSIVLLKDGGQLIFIVPATFMLLDDFKKLRSFLAQNGETNIMYMGPGVFKPEADVATVVLNFVKSKKTSKKLTLSEYVQGHTKPVRQMDNWRGEMLLFETPFSKSLEKLCSHRLCDLYDIRISPRTPEIRHNQLIVKSGDLSGKDYLPVLNGRNLKCNRIIYEPITGYWIKKEDIKLLRNFFLRPRIAVGLGFREDGRVGAAYDSRCYPWMGDVYHLLKKSSLVTMDYDMGEADVVEYLTSDAMKRYVKDVYREVTYHLSITQLKILPLPTKGEWEKIRVSYG